MEYIAESSHPKDDKTNTQNKINTLPLCEELVKNARKQSKTWKETCHKLPYLIPPSRYFWVF